LPHAYDEWLVSRDTDALATVVTAAEAHWLEAARHLIATFQRDAAQGDAQLHRLAGGDLDSLKR
jgi:hypothetical protein